MAKANLFGLGSDKTFQLPFEESFFTQTVASVQNTYCKDEHNYPGLKIGDQTLNKSISYGGRAQRVNIYTSDSLGIIVAFQGTNFSNFESAIEDINLFHVPVHSSTGLSRGSTVFAGWQAQFLKSWKDVKTSLSELLKDHPNEKVQVIGHSQGAAIAQIAALAIDHAFGDVIDKIVCYGPPRVGNFLFAAAFDRKFKGRFVGVTNGEDWVYSVPPQIFGYQHPSGVVWINPGNSTNYEYFTGTEDPQGPSGNFPEYFSADSVKTFPFLFMGDHTGVYMHSSLGLSEGPCPAQVGGF